jgi:hypothetical protein
MDALQSPHAISGDINPSGNPLFGKPLCTQRLLDACRHAGTRFTGSHDDNSPELAQRQPLAADHERIAVNLQVRLHQPPTVNCRHAGMPDRQSIRQQLLPAALHDL